MTEEELACIHLNLLFMSCRVALIGGHAIYKIDDTVMIPIANDQAKIKFSNPDETK